jgi:outer membrane protein assembly factor BamB
MRSYDPETGGLLWEIAGKGRTSITPVGDESLLYLDSFDRLTGGRGALMAIRPGAAGNAESHVAWSVRLDGYRNASPLLYQSCLYILEQNGGIIHCLEASTGAEHYRKRLPKASGFTSSPLGNNGNVYCLDQKGRTIVVEAGPELKVRSSNDLNEMCWASSAVCGKRLLIRALDHLYCIGSE